MARLNWSNDRQAPTDFDNTAPQEVSLEFDYTHQGGAEPWPEKHCGIKFGPALIRRAWASGLFVYAEIRGFPYPVVVKEAQWCDGNVLEVRTLEGPQIAERLFTRPTAAGCTVGGVLIEDNQ
jgi:hypothetical protein